MLENGQESEEDVPRCGIFRFETNAGLSSIVGTWGSLRDFLSNKTSESLHQYAIMGSWFLTSSARWRYGVRDLSSGVMGGSPSGL